MTDGSSLRRRNGVLGTALAVAVLLGSAALSGCAGGGNAALPAEPVPTMTVPGPTVTVTVTETPAPADPSLADPLTSVTAWSLCRTAAYPHIESYSPGTLEDWEIDPYSEGDVEMRADGSYMVDIHFHTGEVADGQLTCLASRTLGAPQVDIVSGD